MVNLKRLYLAIPAVAVLLLAALGGYLWWSSGVIATLKAIQVSAQRDTAGTVGQWRAAQIRDRFREGDGAKTGAGQQADFDLFTGARLQLKPASQIRFLRRGGRGAVGLQVDMGEVDLFTSRGRMTVDSQFGEILIEANSAVVIRRDGVHLSLEVDVGAIEFTREHRRLQAHERVQLELGGLELEARAKTARTAIPAPSAVALVPPRALVVGNGVSDADLVLSPGKDSTIHDPKPPTAVGFAAPPQCRSGLLVTVGKLHTEGNAQGNLRLPVGAHHYELRCIEAPTVVATRGQVMIVQDTGQRPLPSFKPSATVSTDGRKYTVLFQRELPTVTVRWPSAPSATHFTLTAGTRRISLPKPVYTFASGSLPAGTHQLVFTADSSPPRQSRSTQVVIQFDSQAPKGRLSEPPSSGFPLGQDVKIAGQALPGWTVSVGNEELPLDEQRRFVLTRKLMGTLPIAFSSPDRGTHYYLRRPRAPQ